jgi:nicotinate phosphoribosyltransferase
MPSALLTDLYELNMAASYLRRGMDQEATFSLFVRRLPPSRGFLVAAGLEPCLAFLEDFRFGEEELEHLGSRLGFEADTLEAFRELRFDGDVWAVPEGRIVHRGACRRSCHRRGATGRDLLLNVIVPDDVA